ncbi:MAG: SPOR domain-containing protein [Gammaproteobacteria bacterium]|nr:SPOR domain-containing protein [Gammaproteobacteria bacterium]
MAKDYKSNPAQPKQGRNSLGGIYGYGIVLMVGFVIGLWNPFQHMGQSEKVATARAGEDHKLAEKPQETPEDTALSAPKFDFYQLLPEMEVEVVDNVDHGVSDEETSAPGASGRVPPTQKSVASEEVHSEDPKAGPHYLQVGSFKNREEAEHMKVELAFGGFSSSIEKLKTDNGVLHQVQLGPYSTKQDADKVGGALQKRGFVVARVQDRS